MNNLIATIKGNIYFKITILVVIIIIAIVSLFVYLSLSKNYPLATVNGKFISVKDFEMAYTASLNYYEKASKTYNWNDFDTQKEETKKLLKTATLNQLIEDTLIHEGVYEIAGSGAKNILENKLARAINNNEFKKSTETLYQIKFSDYERLFLIPQAEREFLDGRLFLKEKNIDDWLKEKKAKSNINILISEYSWDGEKATLK